MDSGKNLRIEVIAFLAKLSELCNYNTNTPFDAFEVGRKLGLTEDETDTRVNYALGKKWIREPDHSFDRINTGDFNPLPKFRNIYITSEGIDELYKDESASSPNIGSVHYGDNITANVHHAENSPLQIGNKASTQTTNFSESQVKEIEKIITDIEKTIQDNTNGITPEDRLNIESDVRDLRQELSKPEKDKNTILSKIGSLYNKIKNQTPLMALAIQLVSVSGVLGG